MRRVVRRFSLLDVMVLIAATAVGLTIDRVLEPDVPLRDGFDKPLRNVIAVAIALSVPLAAMWTVAALALQLRRPRYRMRRLLQRPGLAACCAATTALALGAGLGMCAVRRNSFNMPALRLIWGFGLPIMAGSAVIAVWAFSMMEGRCRAVSDGHDRLGRLIGLYWVMSILAVGWMLTL